NVVAYFVILAAGATLFKAGVNDIQTASQAAEALRPLAGNLASVLFTLGIIGTGLLAVPVLAGSSAFAVSETFGWNAGLN
ncbi:divalent metal cation transporter, partial [Escherichia coli]|nr:divalent metal cation transporter [Escherichia coli]